MFVTIIFDNAGYSTNIGVIESEVTVKPLLAADTSLSKVFAIL